MRPFFAISALVTVLAISCGGSDSGPNGLTPTPEFTGCMKFAPLSPDTHTIRIRKAIGTTATLITQLADTSAERGVGLSERDCLPEDSGMLFAFPQDTTITFNMRETEIPLTIAFIRADGEIVHMLDMQPLSQDSYASPEPFRYAIEVEQGWFAENGVVIGDIAEIEARFSQNAAT